MVVDSSSPATEPGKLPLPLLEELMAEVPRLPPDAAVSPPPNAPWSMVAIRNHQGDGTNNSQIIFPPINHENLQISTDHTRADNQRFSSSDSDSHSDSDSNSSSTFSPSDSSPSPHSRLISDPAAASAAGAAGWFDSWVEMLYSKVSGLVQLFCSRFPCSRGVFSTFRFAAFTAVLMAFLYFRRRRRLMPRERLIGIIKERDEKINQLLDQISRMNQVLLALHRVPNSSSY